MPARRRKPKAFGPGQEIVPSFLLRITLRNGEDVVPFSAVARKAFNLALQVCHVLLPSPAHDG